MKKITLTLDPNSIGRAIKEVEKLKEWRKQKLSELAKALAELGAEATHYGSMVSVEEIENGWRIVARDDEIAFIEFGAGNATTVLGEVSGVEINPGSWSRSELGTGEYAKYGSWHFDGVKYTEVQPMRGMLRAEETILAQVREVVERVFANG